MEAVVRLGIIAVLSLLTVAAGAHERTSQYAPAQKAAPAGTQARDLTMLMLNAAARHTAAGPATRSQALADLLAAARARHDELSALIDTDPAEILRVALPANLRARLPAQAAPFLEQPADETGDVEVLHFDHVNPAEDFYVYFLHTPKGRFSLHFAADPPDLVSGTKIRVRGTRVDSAIVIAERSDLIVTKAVSVLPNTLGVQKTLAILVNFSDAPTQPYTLAYAQNVMFTTTSNYDYEASYQQTSLAGAVAGWFTIAATSTTCDYSAIATQAKQAASAAGVVLSNYNRYVYVFPANSCTWWGLGSVGGNPSQSWIHTKWGFTLPVIGHEMGHNFGLYHSHSLDCGTSAIAANGCTASDYGDIFDMMGSSNNTPHFNSFQKERLGWLNAGVSPPITTAPTTPGTTTFTIGPMENVRDTMPRAIKIPRGTACAATNEWFYVESRQAKGFDSFLSTNTNVQSGVLIHKVTEGNGDSSYLLDMTPATSSWSDPALVAGQSFTDPLTGLVITPLAVGTTGAQVSVTFPPASCVRAGPTMTATPTGTVWTSAGATTTYSVAVTNKDSCGCAATTYDVGATVPVGWSANNARTAGIVPGGSTSTTVQVTTASGAPAAFYTVAVKAANSAAPTFATSVTSTVAIADVAAFAVTTAATPSTYKLPVKGNGTTYATITATVSNGGTAVAGAAVSVRITDPAGVATTLAATTGSTGVATVSYAMKTRTTKKGTFAANTTATMGSVTATATTSFTVN